MRVFKVNSVDFGVKCTDDNVVFTIGAFDGLHLGHKRLMKACRSLAKRLNALSGILTFSPHPDVVIRNINYPYLLSTDIEKEILFKDTGMDLCVFLPFRKIVDYTPKRFLEYLMSVWNLKGVVVGKNFVFGSKRKGDVSFLKEFLSKYKVEVLVVDDLTIDGFKLSSTYIRGLIKSACLKEAEIFLEKPYWIFSFVVKGERRGRKIGYPTANLMIDNLKLLPPTGVYAGSVLLDKETYPAAVSIGYNITFTNLRTNVKVEVHILNHDGSSLNLKEDVLYKKLLKLFIFEKIRDEIKFENVLALKRQIAKDIIKAVDIFYMRNKKGGKIP